jgi:hypothetical protein
MHTRFGRAGPSHQFQSEIAPAAFLFGINPARNNVVSAVFAGNPAPAIFAGAAATGESMHHVWLAALRQRKTGNEDGNDLN